MDMLRKATNNLFLGPLASLDGWMGRYVPRFLAQHIVNVALAALGTTALRATGRWTFTMISNHTTFRLTSLFLFIALSLTNSARQKTEAASNGSLRGVHLGRVRRWPPFHSNGNELSQEAQQVYNNLYSSSYFYIMNREFSWKDLLAAAKKIAEQTDITLPEVFNRLDYHGNSLAWAILNSQQLESNKSYPIMKGLLEKGANLFLDIERGFNSLLGDHEKFPNVQGTTTLFRLIQDGLLKGVAIEKMKTLWNSKENKKDILHFLKTNPQDFTETIFDAETGEWK